MSWVELSWGWAWKYAGTIIQNNDRVKLQPYFSGLMVSACEDSNHCLGTSIKQEIMGAEYYEENAIHRMKKEAKWREKKYEEYTTKTQFIHFNYSQCFYKTSTTIDVRHVRYGLKKKNEWNFPDRVGG